jgi:aspartyl aminopeptidase
MTDHPTQVADHIADLMRALDESPTPWHVVEHHRHRLQGAGFEEIALDADWSASLPARGFIVRGGALIAWSGAPDDPHRGFRITGAHTDSPGLRVKPRPDVGHLGWRQLGVEIYGGVLLNSWLDRDLGIAGRVVTDDGQIHLMSTDEPIARLPQLAIHLDRDVNDRGLVLDKQTHITPVWGVGAVRPGDFADWVAARVGQSASAIAGWDLCLYDVTPARILGSDGSLLASGRLDNQLSCWAAITALIAGRDLDHHDGHVDVVALFDHEEVGSESTTGAAGPLLETVLERLVVARGGGRDAFLRACSASLCLSADNAHAVHPNYPERHDPEHRPIVGGGPAIKVNANQRYATDAVTAAAFRRACTRAGVPHQSFVSKNTMPCGSTIGPITATRLGIPTVDVGVPQLSMHSARELCGIHDVVHLHEAIREWFAGD